ncbi:DUF3443 family protein [Paraburkholderia sp. UYCP14C]|uniref:DUF3443 family protein n=1 Tax=Paraburkholderia sp. UYCP14C TaxID=2511130 RepID=UPI001020BCAB|nr:DUF3443 family protein [Paraburkholderia sp. UYCP14C]RZF26199.1 DUF3443 family protein [Paraburkholderia sp. UYCP14C]
MTVTAIVKIIAISLIVGLSACGGGGSGGDSSDGGSTRNSSPPQQQSSRPAANVVNMTFGSNNTPTMTVTVCEPGTSNCANIDNVEIDTGSVGLRLWQSALPSSLNLPQEIYNGFALADCVTYVVGSGWGPMVTADVKISGETAASVPVHVINNAYAGGSATCNAYGVLPTLYNGILGIGNELSDGDTLSVCTGNSCVRNQDLTNSLKAANPVVRFAHDNNGYILSFPNASTSGTLTFGLGTETNNPVTGVRFIPGYSQQMLAASINGVRASVMFDTGAPANIVSSSLNINGTANQTIQVGVPDDDTMPVTFNLQGANLARSGDAIFHSPVLVLGMPYLFGHTRYLRLPQHSSSDFADQTAGGQIALQ